MLSQVTVVFCILQSNQGKSGTKNIMLLKFQFTSANEQKLEQLNNIWLHYAIFTLSILQLVNYIGASYQFFSLRQCHSMVCRHATMAFHCHQKIWLWNSEAWVKLIERVGHKLTVRWAYILLLLSFIFSYLTGGKLLPLGVWCCPRL